jgi:starch synthase
MSLASGAATGVQFAPVETPMLESAIRRTLALYRAPEAWRRLQLNGMATDVSWSQSAQRYAQLYAELVAERAG